ncbi:menaquinone biosynthesis protein [Leptospira hartskeerlii]|uniref:Chorismate dehydratase n=1 Tax=Leptospira hartskeerlii TaxID=2023177 RepID=A0A2M9XG62_9LEPT|nr:menaquinone biosynthesis protein [Leptospira hartskeerlii]PJZ26624.1 menaquinone biosynthesis protein [Leptospira hartskeerlii]PJZ34893.1 menaquinone biosynthesis protein [Leptospira hartskeerlii]
MRIGIVKHLNARPLTWGFEQNSEHKVVPENPSLLKDYLLRGLVDVGLISSIECLRNEDVLSVSMKVGVCASEQVRSIKFFKNKKEAYPPYRILTDNGSRTSMALVRVLVHNDSGKLPEVAPTDPKIIKEEISIGRGSHMLFGDNALFAEWDPEVYEVKDLAEWWYETTGTSFIFALWASKKPLELPDSFYEDSLKYGLAHIEEIIQKESRLPTDLVRTYLTQELHYEITESDRKGFELFGKYCNELGIL